ncbi:hypothetical protein C0992_003999 [Termitomyces sp. T32_za158]|nr:hypothetical protein C0992_003999 [Termitomyces sp. T32_za158]
MEGSTSELHLERLQSDLYLSKGLSGQDERFDYLLDLFEQLQLATVETCNPDMDLASFAQTAYYFAVIMRRKRERDLKRKTSSSSDYQGGVPVEITFPSLSMVRDEAIGLVYLVNSADSAADHLHDRELNIGIILESLHRGKGYAHQAIEMVLKVAFEVEKCHRVQAVLPDHVAKDHAICFFTQMRFDHEGTRRRAFFSRMEGVYKDVTYMGILDTDWMLRQTDCKRAQKFGCPAPKSVWDELLSRHQREREELLNWEAGIRSSRMSKPRAQTPTQSCFRTVEANDDDEEMEFENTLDVASMREPKDGEMKSKTLLRGQEHDPFEISTDADTISTRSASPDGYFSTASSSASMWDVIESDLDSLPSSSPDSGDEAAFEFVESPSM